MKCAKDGKPDVEVGDQNTILNQKVDLMVKQKLDQLVKQKVDKIVSEKVDEIVTSRLEDVESDNYDYESHDLNYSDEEGHTNEDFILPDKNNDSDNIIQL